MAEERDEELDRIIRRAQQLDDEPTEAVDHDALINAAAEAGISPEAMRHSVAIERLGPAPRRRAGDRVVGPRRVVVERRVERSGDDLVAALDDWLTSGHHLRRVERSSERIVWRKRTDAAASMQRAVKSFAGAAALGSVQLIEARVIAIDQGSSLVRIEADRSGARTTTLGATGGIGGAALAAGGVAAVAAPPMAVLAVPGLLVAGVAARHGRRSADRLDTELVRLFDQLVAGERPSLLPRRSRR
ncbi:MAG: hypothetical protein AAGA99_02285 [Actinomycetota bacterium]